MPPLPGEFILLTLRKRYPFCLTSKHATTLHINSEIWAHLLLSLYHLSFWLLQTRSFYYLLKQHLSSKKYQTRFPLAFRAIISLHTKIISVSVSHWSELTHVFSGNWIQSSETHSAWLQFKVQDAWNSKVYKWTCQPNTFWLYLKSDPQ